MNFENLKNNIATLSFYLDDRELTELLNSDNNIKNSFLKESLILESKFQKFFKENKIPEMDYALFDGKQLKDEKMKTRMDYLSPVDYQLSFLIYMFLNYEKLKNMELIDIIESYLQKIKNSLRLPDIERTKTGSVRCKTNIRFALKNLRSEGLIETRDEEYKRSWSLTLTGFLVSAFIVITKPFPFCVIKNMLSERKPVNSGFKGFQKLYEIMFANEGYNKFVNSIAGDEFEILRTICLQSTLYKIRIAANNIYENFNRNKQIFEHARYIEALNKLEKSKAVEFLKCGLSELGNMRLVQEEAEEILFQ